jgi:RNA polymerase sigma factor (sigma-70 family)
LAVQTRLIPFPRRDHESAQPQDINNEEIKPAKTQIDWTALVSQIKKGEEAGMEQLYKVFQRGIRYHICRQLGPQDLDDRLHETFIVVVKAIRRGDLREPERLMGFVRTVAQRQVAAYIEQAIQKRKDAELEQGFFVTDRRLNPEEAAVVQQKAALIQDSLAAMSKKDKEILVRFYLKEQPQEKICEEMDLTETQFRLLKSRAKAKFGEIGKKKLASSGILSVMVRATAAN